MTNLTYAQYAEVCSVLFSNISNLSNRVRVNDTIYLDRKEILVNLRRLEARHEKWTEDELKWKHGAIHKYHYEKMQGFLLETLKMIEAAREINGLTAPLGVITAKKFLANLQYKMSPPCQKLFSCFRSAPLQEIHEEVKSVEPSPQI